MHVRLAAILTLAFVASAAVAARAETQGAVVVHGNALAHERGVVQDAIASRVREASWVVASQAFSTEEVHRLIACLDNDRPWPCFAETARMRGVTRIVVARLDRSSSAGKQLVIAGQLLVAGNDVPTIAEGFCDQNCSDASLRVSAARVADRLIQDTAARGQETMIEVTSEPPGATVTLDGERLGVTNLKRATHAGVHSLVIQREGYRQVVRSENVEAGRVTTVHVKLESDSAEARSTRDPRIVPGIMTGVGVLALAAGTVISFTADADEDGQQNKYIYSVPGIVTAVGGGVLAGVGVYLWVRASRNLRASTAKPRVALPALAPTSGGVMAGWSVSF